MITIDNGRVSVVISEKGAELQSVRMAGREYLWQGDPAFWPRRAPIMFPICGGNPGDRYTVGGREYHIPQHGYTKDSVFLCEEQSAESAAFLLLSDDASRAQYPFDYELRVRYTLRDDKMYVSFDVSNTGGDKMWFSVGAHEGWACPGGLDGCDLIFDREERLEALVVENTRATGARRRIAADGRTLHLGHGMMLPGGMFFRGLASEGVRLVQRESGHGVRVDFGGAEYLGLWSVPGADYICIEPWCGFAASDGMDDLTRRAGIRSLEAGESFAFSHSVTLF